MGNLYGRWEKIPAGKRRRKRIIGMNTWMRIVLVSALALMLLEPAAIATGTAQENATTWAGGYYGAYQRANLPLGDVSGSSPIPVTPGCITAEADSTQATLAIASGPSVSGVPIFPTDHIWNIRVDSLPVDSRSADYIGTIGSTAYLHADFGSGMYDGSPIGIPYNIVDGSQEKKTVLFDYADESDPGPYPIPDNPFIEGGSDHHMVIIDRDAKMLYELFAAEKQADGSWAAGSGAVFNLSDYTLRPAGWTSADAAGLAILPGLVRYDEVNAGEINHALRFTAPSTRRAYIWPARHYASSITDLAYPPMGQRFRLKSSFDTSGYPAQAQIVLNALKKYGMILADNGAPWYITGAPDERWDNDALHTLHQLKGTDFEAVDSSSLMIDQNSGQSLTQPAVTASPHRTGVYRPGVGFYLKMDNSSTWNPSTDRYLAWDNALGDRPVAGDWNADGRTETGVYRPGVGFYLKMDNGSIWNPSTDRYLAWDNAASDRPIAGDWNMDGRAETGVHRPGVGFYLKMDNGSTWNPSTDVYLAWDNAAVDRPIAGDWNLDGRAETGVYRPGVGFYLKMDNGSTWTPSTDVYLAWDNAAVDRPIAGDWNADGRAETGVYRPGVGFYLKMDNGSTWNPSTDKYLALDNAVGDLPIAGNFV